MKKRLSLILAAVVAAVLLYGCGGSSTGTTNNASKDNETAVTETTQAPAQEETTEATEPALEEGSEATAPAQEEATAEATAAAEAEGASETPTGFKIMSRNMTGRSGARTDIIKYDQDGDSVCVIANDDENKSYHVHLFEKQFDESGKWIGSTIYAVNQETAIDPANTDIYKTEANIVGSETCSYDDNGLVLEGTDTDGNVVTRDTYDQQHKVILSQTFNDGSEVMKISYTYDEQGILIEEKHENKDGVRVIKYTPIGVTPYATLNTFDDETVSESELKEIAGAFL